LFNVAIIYIEVEMQEKWILEAFRVLKYRPREDEAMF
jgi:hypothetical protein